MSTSHNRAAPSPAWMTLGTETWSNWIPWTPPFKKRRNSKENKTDCITTTLFIISAVKMKAFLIVQRQWWLDAARDAHFAQGWNEWGIIWWLHRHQQLGFLRFINYNDRIICFGSFLHCGAWDYCMFHQANSQDKYNSPAFIYWSPVSGTHISAARSLVHPNFSYTQTQIHWEKERSLICLATRTRRVPVPAVSAAATTFESPSSRSSVTLRTYVCTPPSFSSAFTSLLPFTHSTRHTHLPLLRAVHSPVSWQVSEIDTRYRGAKQVMRPKVYRAPKILVSIATHFKPELCTVIYIHTCMYVYIGIYINIYYIYILYIYTVYTYSWATYYVGDICTPQGETAAYSSHSFSPEDFSLFFLIRLYR